MGTKQKTEKTPKLKPILINQGDVALLLGVPRESVIRWAKTQSGFPRAVRVIDRTYLFSRKDVAAWARIRDEAIEEGPSQDESPPSDAGTPR